MDVLVLLDRLAELVEGARPVPLTDQVRVDREQIYGLLDEMRTSIPEEVKQARRLVKDRQALLGEAEGEAERIVAEARQQAARASGQSEIVRIAERQADARLAKARREANMLTSAVEEWADEHLAVLETNLDNFLTTIRRGRQRLRERSQVTAAVRGGSDRAGEREEAATASR